MQVWLPSVIQFLVLKSPGPSRVFCPFQEDQGWHGADLGLQLRGGERGGQGAAVLLRGHRLPGPAALSLPLLQRPGARFPSVRAKLLLKKFSVLPFSWKITDGHRAGMDLGCAGGDSGPWASPVIPHDNKLPQGKSFSCFPPNFRHKPTFSSSKHFPGIPRKCFPPSWG